MKTATTSELKQFFPDLDRHNFSRHVPGPLPDVTLFGSGRSGMSLLMEAIAAASGLKYIAQHLSVPTTSPLQLQHLEISPDGELFAPSEDEQDQRRLLVTGVLDRCLKSLPSIHVFPRRSDRHFLTHGDFILDGPSVMADRVVAFNLPDIDSMQRVANQAAKATKHLSDSNRQTALVHPDKEALLKSWRREIDEKRRNPPCK